MATGFVAALGPGARLPDHCGQGLLVTAATRTMNDPTFPSDAQVAVTKWALGRLDTPEARHEAMLYILQNKTRKDLASLSEVVAKLADSGSPARKVGALFDEYASRIETRPRGSGSRFGRPEGVPPVGPYSPGTGGAPKPKGVDK